MNVLTLASNDFLHFCFECLQRDYLKQEAEVAALQPCGSAALQLCGSPQDLSSDWHGDWSTKPVALYRPSPGSYFPSVPLSPPISTELAPFAVAGPEPFVGGIHELTGENAASQAPGLEAIPCRRVSGSFPPFPGVLCHLKVGSLCPFHICGASVSMKSKALTQAAGRKAGQHLLLHRWRQLLADSRSWALGVPLGPQTKVGDRKTSQPHCCQARHCSCLCSALHKGSSGLLTAASESCSGKPPTSPRGAAGPEPPHRQPRQ